MQRKNLVAAVCAEDVLLVVLGAEADDVNDEQAGLRPQHGDIQKPGRSAGGTCGCGAGG